MQWNGRKAVNARRIDELSVGRSRRGPPDGPLPFAGSSSAPNGALPLALASVRTASPREPPIRPVRAPTIERSPWVAAASDPAVA
jgi:hypothetical protein